MVIEAATIHWPLPGEPEMIWKPVGLLAADGRAEEVQRNRHSILESAAFFAICQRCQKRHPKGWMHDHRTCQSCAVDHLGVVY